MLGIDDLLLGTLVGGVGSGLITTAGQLYANKQNLKYQTKVNDINWQIAAQNNATQIDMANTAHQREVEDLRAAGLNPILSAGGSGAGTPNLTNMRGDSAQIENPVAGLGNSAKALGRYISGLADAELAQRNADVQLTEDQAELTRSEHDRILWQMRNQPRYNDLQAEQIKYDTELMKIKNEALRDLAYDKHDDIYGGKHHVSYHLNKRDYSFYNNVKRGIWSDSQLQATGALRAGISSAVEGVNGASSLLRAFNTKRRRK